MSGNVTVSDNYHEMQENQKIQRPYMRIKVASDCESSSMDMNKIFAQHVQKEAEHPSNQQMKSFAIVRRKSLVSNSRKFQWMKI